MCENAARMQPKETISKNRFSRENIYFSSAMFVDGQCVFIIGTFV